MLETKPQFMGQAARQTAPRPLTSSPYTGRAATARAIPERAPGLPMGGDTEQRMARSEARLLAGTVSAAFLVCGLLVVYLAAYARATTLDIAQSKMQTLYNARWQENQLLRAQEAALKSPYRIADRAVRLGLTRTNKPADYIPPSQNAPDVSAPIMVGVAAQADVFSDDMTTNTGSDAATKAGAEAGSQGTDSGPTKYDNSTTRHH